MNTPALHADEDKADNHLSRLEKWIVTLLGWLILIFTWAAAMEAYGEW